MKFAFWNAGGYTKEKASGFEIILVNSDIDAFCIVEADSSSAIENENKRTTTWYNIYTLPCSRRRAIGIIIGVKQHLIAENTLFRSQEINKGKSGSYFFHLRLIILSALMRKSKKCLYAKQVSLFDCCNNTKSIITLTGSEKITTIFAPVDLLTFK
jgi:hypothetical protein